MTSLTQSNYVSSVVESRALPQEQKNTETHVKRPLNSYQLWVLDEKRRMSRENPQVRRLNTAEEFGNSWAQMSDAEKQPYKDMGEELKRQHKIKYPDYKYRPRRKASKGKKREVNSVVVKDQLYTGIKRSRDMSDEDLQSVEYQRTKMPRYVPILPKVQMQVPTIQEQCYYPFWFVDLQIDALVAQKYYDEQVSPRDTVTSHHDPLLSEILETFI